VLTNDELKKKIAQIIAEYCCPFGKRISNYMAMIGCAIQK
jgi:hypothetical protein